MNEAQRKMHQKRVAQEASEEQFSAWNEYFWEVNMSMAQFPDGMSAEVMDAEMMGIGSDNSWIIEFLDEQDAINRDRWNEVWKRGEIF